MPDRKVRNFYTTIVAVLFMLIAGASSQGNKIYCGAFSYSNIGEDQNESRSYLEKNDGTRLYGEGISSKTGQLVKDFIKIGDEKFRVKEIRGYFSHGYYYGRFNNGYAKRIIHGKLNVYYTLDHLLNVDSKGRESTSEVCYHYVQVGDDGEIHFIANQKDIQQYVKDCPKSMEMIDKKYKELMQSIRRNRDYLNQIFIIYNNNCR
jgi:hypothetical protein